MVCNCKSRQIYISQQTKTDNNKNVSFFHVPAPVNFFTVETTTTVKNDSTLWHFVKCQYTKWQLVGNVVVNERLKCKPVKAAGSHQLRLDVFWSKKHLTDRHISRQAFVIWLTDFWSSGFWLSQCQLLNQILIFLHRGFMFVLVKLCSQKRANLPYLKIIYSINN